MTEKKYGGEDFGKTLEQLKKIAPLAETVNGVRFEGDARKVGAILDLAGVAGELIAEIELLTVNRGFLLADLQEAAATLRRYETLHRAKGTEESTAKAEVNAELAARFESTIKAVLP